MSAISTESLRWRDDDYDATAGTIDIRPTGQADSTPHLSFVDLTVTTNEGETIKLERLETGKLLYILLMAEREGQRAKRDRTGKPCIIHRAIPEEVT